MPEQSPISSDRTDAGHRPGRLRKLGTIAFLFFFIKGLLWLVIPAAIFTWGC